MAETKMTKRVADLTQPEFYFGFKFEFEFEFVAVPNEC